MNLSKTDKHELNLDSIRKQAEEKVRQAEKKKKIQMRILIALVGICLIGGVIALTLQKPMRLSQAEKLIQEEKYTEAKEILENLKDYKNANTLLEQINLAENENLLKKAETYMSEGKYQAAQNAYLKAGNEEKAIEAERQFYYTSMTSYVTFTENLLQILDQIYPDHTLDIAYEEEFLAPENLVLITGVVSDAALKDIQNNSVLIDLFEIYCKKVEPIWEQEFDYPFHIKLILENKTGEILLEADEQQVYKNAFNN